MVLKVLMSGEHGFLMRNVLKKYHWEIETLKENQEYTDKDLVIHFASPVDIYDFKNKDKMVNANIELTITAVKAANNNNCKLIFASSMAVNEIENDYGVLKRAAELYIETYCHNYCIMRIPRVYGRDRDKGLMKRIKNADINDSDWDKEIEYIDIQDFKDWFDTVLDKNMIQYYDKIYKKHTIKQIKEIYCEF